MRPALLYRLWVVIVAVMMIALPVAYVAIIGLVMVAVLLNAAHHAADLSHINGLIALRAAVLAYVPCFGGAVLVALLLKPLFGRPARGRSRGRSTAPTSRCYSPSSRGSATPSGPRGRRGSRWIAASTPRPTATAPCSTSGAASWC